MYFLIYSATIILSYPQPFVKQLLYFNLATKVVASLVVFYSNKISICITYAAKLLHFLKIIIMVIDIDAIQKHDYDYSSFIHTIRKFTL